MTYRVGDRAVLTRGVAPFLEGVRVEIIRISGLGTLTVKLLEDAHGASCWKANEIMHVQPYNLKEYLK